jgi:hypothetical protein
MEQEFKVVKIKCKKAMKSGSGEMLLIGKKIYYGNVLLPKLQTLTMKDEKGNIRTFGYKGTPYNKDKTFTEIFEQVD